MSGPDRNSAARSMIHHNDRDFEPDAFSSLEPDDDPSLYLGTSPPVRTREAKREKIRNQSPKPHYTGRGSHEKKGKYAKRHSRERDRHNSGSGAHAAHNAQHEPDGPDKNRHAKQKLEDLRRSHERDVKSTSDFTVDFEHVHTNVQPAVVEGPVRYKCLMSEPVPNNSTNDRTQRQSSKPGEYSRDRDYFYKLFSTLITMGSKATKEKERRNSNFGRQFSSEQEIWKTQLNDTVWLGLQAYLHGRCVGEQDELLFKERNKVGDVLEEVMHFRYRSGDPDDSFSPTTFLFDDPNSTINCLFMNVSTGHSQLQDVVRQQGKALVQVAALLAKVESVEQLYPTTKSLGKDHPLYNSERFVIKINTLCLWLNITRNLGHTFKLLAKVLGIEEVDCFHWPWLDYDCEKSSSDWPSSPGAHSDEPTSIVTDNQHSSNDNRDCGVSRTRRVSFCLSPDDSGSEDTESNSDTEPPDTATRRWLASQGTNRTAIYRSFVDKSLKKMSLRKLLDFRLRSLLERPLQRSKEALERPGPRKYDFPRSNMTGEPGEVPPSPGWTSLPQVVSKVQSKLQSGGFMVQGTWTDQISAMGLPSFRPNYLFLARIPLDVVHECVRLRLEQRPMGSVPSVLGLPQLIREYREVLKCAILAKDHYQQMLAPVMWGDSNTQTESSELDIDHFDDDVKEIFQIYLSYMQAWMPSIQSLPEFSRAVKNALDDEWLFTKELCPCIVGGEVEAGRRFCSMASGLLKSISEFLECGIEKITHGNQLTEDSPASSTVHSEYRQSFMKCCRDFKNLAREARERAAKAIGFAKTLRKDLEIAADFNVNVTNEEFLAKLKDSNHCRVDISSAELDYLLFIPHYIAENRQHVVRLLNVTCGQDLVHCQDYDDETVGYMLLVRKQPPAETGAGETGWDEPVLDLKISSETTENLSGITVDNLLLIVAHSSSLGQLCKEFQRTVGPTVVLANEQTSCYRVIRESLAELKETAMTLREKITESIDSVDAKLTQDQHRVLDDSEKIYTKKLYRETMHQCFNFGFEYHREVIRLVTGDTKLKLGKKLMYFAKDWMKFVCAKCERGRGTRPRWSLVGLDFLTLAFEPKILATLTEDEYHDLKHQINICIAHVIGSAGHKTPSSPDYLKSPEFPTGGMHRPYSCPDTAKVALVIPVGPPSSTPNTPFSVPQYIPDLLVGHSRASRNTRLCNKIKSLEEKRERYLRDRRVIGHTAESKLEVSYNIHIRRVNFKWQMGQKLGEGQFGKVYAAVNVDTGELLAMKEIRFQPNDHQTIKDIADEIKNLEGIHHQSLVGYYGVEVHRDEMLIFMEYCNEGTLQDAAELGLPEPMIRQYTKEILVAVHVLHEHGIVHRDIKGANIFLNSVGPLKLGDFGSSVKLKSHTTMPGEVNALVGTTAFMAPEVITHSEGAGHGRAADIWSLGCVIIEMATGKRPWHELENNYQIMFKIGMGAIPPIPESLSEEGQNFLEHCFEPDPKDRWTANQLQDHPFTKVSFEDDFNY